MTGPFLYRMRRTAGNGHAPLQDESLVYTDLFHKKVGAVYLEIVLGIGNGGSQEVVQRAFGLLLRVDEDIIGISNALASDHIGYDTDFAGRDAVIFERGGDHGGVLFLWGGGGSSGLLGGFGGIHLGFFGLELYLLLHLASMPQEFLCGRKFAEAVSDHILGY